MVDVIIIGAGAAGLMCALEAGRCGRSVLLLEGNTSIGEKIRISGGGRCNFTNLHASPYNFLSSNPHFCRSALARYTPDDFIRFIEEHGIAYHEKIYGQLFCDGSAIQITEALHRDCSGVGVQFMTGRRVEMVEKTDHFSVVTDSSTLISKKVVIATGGLSIPSLGATDFGYRIAEKFDIQVVTPKPGLVPFVLRENDRLLCRELSGVSVPVTISSGRMAFSENMLFTHQGISGPAVLQISSYWNPGEEIVIDLLPDIDIENEFEMHRQSTKEIKTVLSDFLPKRFAEAWCRTQSMSSMVQHTKKKEIQNIAHHLHHWILQPEKTEGFLKAEVTVGGVDTSELSSKTMETKKIPGLYFIGEVVDVTGQLGGFNFQWAWASGAAAGKAI
jgi:predicted Rossmann fold flavoprotein